MTAFLRANGVRVMALDVAPARRALAQALGAEKVVILGQQDLRQEVRAWTQGYGIDAAVLAASAATNGPTEQALEVLRDRGRLVVVGKTKVDLPWEYAFGKEIEVRFSRSYGPGRYDPSYEWAGSDYPIGYVRWTEQRNFEACLQLMKTGDLNITALTTRRAPFTQALQVYQHLMGEGGASEAGVILEYGDPVRASESPVASATPRLTLVQKDAPPATDASAAPHAEVTVPNRPVTQGELRLAAPVARIDVIGAGNFARTMLLPRFERPSAPAIGSVVNNANGIEHGEPRPYEVRFRDGSRDRCRSGVCR